MLGKKAQTCTLHWQLPELFERLLTEGTACPLSMGASVLSSVGERE